MPEGKLHILHLNNSWEFGGVKRNILDLALGQIQSGAKCWIAAWNTQKEDITQGITFLHLPLYNSSGTRKSFSGFLRSIRLLSDLIAREQIDIIHMHSRYVTLLCRCVTSANRRGKVYTAHSAFSNLRFLHWYPKHVICPSEAVKKSFRRLVSNPDKHEILVIPHGVPTIMKNSGEESDYFPLEVKERDPLFVFLGRFVHIKGGDLLIRAVQYLQDKYRMQVKVLFIGDGECRQEWHSLAERSGISSQIEFKGYTDDPQHYLENAATLVVPSRELEGFGYVIADAMVRGCPVIASDLPSFQEHITDEHTGLLFTADDSIALAQKMKYAIDHGEIMLEMTKRARQIAQDKFSLERMIRQTLEVYRNVLTRK